MKSIQDVTSEFLQQQAVFLDAQEHRYCCLVTCVYGIISPGLGTPSEPSVTKTILTHYSNTMKQLYDYD